MPVIPNTRHANTHNPLDIQRSALPALRLYIYLGMRAIRRLVCGWADTTTAASCAPLACMCAAPPPYLSLQLPHAAGKLGRRCVLGVVPLHSLGILRSGTEGQHPMHGCWREHSSKPGRNPFSSRPALGAARLPPLDGVPGSKSARPRLRCCACSAKLTTEAAHARTWASRRLLLQLRRLPPVLFDLPLQASSGAAASACAARERSS